MDTPCQTVSSIDYLVTQGYRDTMGVSDQPEQPPAKDGDELGRLLEEQAALRRVATLVAEGAPPAEVFQAVSFEVAQLLHAEGAALTRFETDGTVTALGGWTSTGGYLHAGTRFALEGTVSGLVFESGQPAPDSQVRRRARRSPCRRPRDGLALVGGGADHRRGPPLGGIGRCLEERPAPAPRHRTASGGVHPTGGDRHREH